MESIAFLIVRRESFQLKKMGMINLNTLEFTMLYNSFYDFYYEAKKACFYNDEIERMRISIDEMYTSYFIKKWGNF